MRGKLLNPLDARSTKMGPLLPAATQLKARWTTIVERGVINVSIRVGYPRIAWFRRDVSPHDSIGIEALQYGTGLGSREAPMGCGSRLVASSLPCRYFRSAGPLIR